MDAYHRLFAPGLGIDNELKESPHADVVDAQSKQKMHTQVTWFIRKPINQVPTIKSTYSFDLLTIHERANTTPLIYDVVRRQFGFRREHT